MMAMNECSGKTAAIGIFFDAEKAYDMCPHEGIISSLATTYNMPPFLLQIIRSFLSNRKQIVRVEDSFSSLRNVKSGVPQGSILASLLFIAYTAPVQRISFSNGASTVAYADDLCYLRAIREENRQIDIEEIESDINKIKGVITDLKMKLNVDKTKVVVFSVAPIPPEIPILYLDGEAIEELSTYKYLGVWVDRKLSWNIHTRKKISTAKRALGTLSRCRRYLPPAVTRLVYKTVIQPQFLYATSITYPKNRKDQISFEYVNKYAASLISDKHTGSYEACIESAALRPIWMIAAIRRISLFSAYVAEKRFLPDGLLTTVVPPNRRPGLRSREGKPDENRRQFAPPIDSRRAHCEKTALAVMIGLWNAIPQFFNEQNFKQYQNAIKTGDIIKSLIKSETINLFLYLYATLLGL